MRVGHGFHADTLDPSRTLVLAGTEIEGPPGLSGPSGADPVVRAVAAALLGAAGLDGVEGRGGEDGGAADGPGSRGLLASAVRSVEAENFQVVNVDVTVSARTPVLDPHAERVERALAECLHVGPDRVSVKEGGAGAPGWVSAEDGLGAVAVVLLDRRDGPGPLAALRAGG